MSRFQLGAEELIELGRPARRELSGRRPFLGGEPGGRPFISNRPRLGIFAEIGGFLANLLGGAFNLLAEIVKVPTDILASGVDIIFTNVADLLGEIPILGELVAQILLIGNSVIQWGLKVPAQLLGGLGNVLTGLGKSLTQEFTDDEQKGLAEEAKKKIIDEAPDDIKSKVTEILTGPPKDGNGRTTGNGTGAAGAGPDLGDIIKVGAPIAAGVALVALVLS